MIKNYLDENGKIVVLPRKKKVRRELYRYLMDAFEYGRSYSEKEVNDIIKEHHVFNDVCLLRRELVEYGGLNRDDDGTSYKKGDIVTE